MKTFNRYAILFFAVLLSINSTYAQTNCGKNLIDAENFYQSGRLYSIPEKLLDCIEKGFNNQERLNAYRLLTLTYLNINQEENAKKTMLELLKLNPDYPLEEKNDPQEFVNLMKSFHTSPIYYMGFNFGTNASLPLVLNGRSLNSIEGRNGKTYNPEFGFSLSANITFPLTNLLFFETGIGYENMSYGIKNEFFTDGTADDFAVQEWTGKETFNQILFPANLLLNNKTKSYKFNWNAGIGLGLSYLIASDFNSVIRKNNQILSEDVTRSSINTRDRRNHFNVFFRSFIGADYKFGSVFLGGKIGYQNWVFNQPKHKTYEQMYFNEMALDFAYIDDNFVMRNLFVEFTMRRPFYNFLKK